MTPEQWLIQPGLDPRECDGDRPIRAHLDRGSGRGDLSAEQPVERRAGRAEEVRLVACSRATIGELQRERSIAVGEARPRR
jgi:hypothetical protein